MAFHDVRDFFDTYDRHYMYQEGRIIALLDKNGKSCEQDLVRNYYVFFIRLTNSSVRYLYPRAFLNSNLLILPNLAIDCFMSTKMRLGSLIARA